MSFETLNARDPLLAVGRAVRHLHLAPRAFLPMRAMPEVTLTEGRASRAIATTLR